MHYTPKQTKAFLDHIGAKKEPNDFEKRLFKQAWKHVRMISWLPGVRLVAVCNSLSFYATHEHSDIDLFIVTAPRRMWLARILVSGWFTMLGIRRRNLNKIKALKEDVYHHFVGKFCLSFFCTTEALGFSDIALEDDIYLHHWLSYLKPIVDIDDTMSLLHEKNDIISEEIPPDSEDYQITSRKSRNWESWKIFDWMDDVCKQLFLPRTLRSYTELGKPFGVVIHEHMLKFHDEDRRGDIRDQIL